MSTLQRRIIWRVRTADSTPHPAAFDALIIKGGSGAERLSRLLAVDVPFEREFPDGELTIVVRTSPRSPALITECETVTMDGASLGYGRSHNALAVFVFSAQGLAVTGLPAPAEPDATTAC